MTAEWLENAGGLIAALAALLTGLAGVLGYLNRREKIRGVRDAFDRVIASLASDVEVERMAGAILLRRFFDPDTEVGVAGTPYWKEAVNVTAAILRGRETGHFQKLLADGLAFAPSLERADLQRTNLSGSYLGVRKRGRSDPTHEDLVPNLGYADFYRADLSGASLKGALARGAVFYQARLVDTVLRGADLREANFFEADLKGARFDGARLEGASFRDARNRPPGIAERLDGDGVYRDREPFARPVTREAQADTRVFISKPGYLTDGQRQRLAEIMRVLQQEDFQPQMLEPRDYPPSGALAEIDRIISSCAGAIIVGFPQLHVREGSWRPGTPQEQPVQGGSYATPWNQVEAGIAAAYSLPVLMLTERNVREGVFDLAPGEHRIHRAALDGSLEDAAFKSAFTAWCADVRERCRR
jgi:hypothetical protein